jgi:hypothetical protein
VRVLFVFFIVLTVSACLGNIEYDYPTNPNDDRRSRSGKFFDDDIILYGKKKDVDRGVNYSVDRAKNKLFISARDVVSEIIAIDVEDFELGMISTKWGTSKRVKEKTKITVLLAGTKAIESNVNVSIYKKYLDSNGIWRDKKMHNEDLLIKLLKDKIISRAQ